MKYLVSWSGGIDSTYLIQKLLEDGHEVTAIYTKIYNNEEKTKRELKAIENINNYFKNNDNYNFKIAAELNINEPNTLLELLQFPFFIFSLLYHCEGFDKVVIGYIMGDDAISYIEDFKNIWNSFKGIYSNNFPDIEFPLIKEHKKYILDKIDKRYLEHNTWCEANFPTDSKFCNVCIPCKKLKFYNLESYFETQVVVEKCSE